MRLLSTAVAATLLLTAGCDEGYAVVLINDTDRAVIVAHEGGLPPVTIEPGDRDSSIGEFDSHDIGFLTVRSIDGEVLGTAYLTERRVRGAKHLMLVSEIIEASPAP